MPTAVQLLFLAAAWLGHAFALTVALNLIYSFALPRKLQRGGRLAVAIAVFGFPFAVYWCNASLANYGQFEAPVVAYLRICAFIGGVLFPAMTVLRLFRRPPAELVGRASRVVDIAEELGSRPLGYGEHWRMARMPYNQVLQVEFSDITLRLPRLPTVWNGLSILHVSDLHFHGTPERSFFTRALAHAMDAGPPDLLCLTGDFVDTIHHLRWIKPQLGTLHYREAGFAILGNHDFWCAPDSVRRQLKRTGLRVVGNAWQQLIIRDEPLVIVGHEGPWFSPPPDLSDCPPEPFRLCLSHTPDNIPWAARNGVDLLLAGHVHGGQIRLPIVGPLFVPSRYSRKYDGGCYRERNMIACVNRGLSGREPLRWNCRPEITRIRLVT
jgi:predicted MPP superfamily phosphohydrolase